jgi:DNA-directed RNA polymerase subunit RPC12/RpoP
MVPVQLDGPMTRTEISRSKMGASLWATWGYKGRRSLDRTPCYSVSFLLERRRPLGLLTYAQELSRSMAFSSCSSQAGAQDNGPYPLIACPYCGSRVLTRIASTGRRPGTRYYKCERYSVSSPPPSRSRIPSCLLHFYAEIFTTRMPLHFEQTFPPFFFQRIVVFAAAQTHSNFCNFILPRAGIAVSLSGLRVTPVGSD